MCVYVCARLRVSLSVYMQENTDRIAKASRHGMAWHGTAYLVTFFFVVVVVVVVATTLPV